MKKPDESQDQSASELITKRIAELGDWRGETLGSMRKLIKEADPTSSRSGSGWALVAPSLHTEVCTLQRPWPGSS